MLFAKGLSILFSLFAGLESAKAALYHFVCGKGKDRVFPYLAEIKEYLLENNLLEDLTNRYSESISDGLSLWQAIKSSNPSWKDDLYFTVGGFAINSEITKEGLYLHLEDYYDWHGGNSWFIPGDFIQKIPNIFKNILKNQLHAEECVDGSWRLEESFFNSFGQSYWHKGTIFYTWQELGVDLSYAIGRIGPKWFYDSHTNCFGGNDIMIYPDYIVAGPKCDLYLPVVKMQDGIVSLPSIGRRRIDNNYLKDLWEVIGFAEAKLIPICSLIEDNEEEYVFDDYIDF